MSQQPGLVALFGSGETSASGRRIHDWVLQRLMPPINVAVLETPAGFQPNSALVAGKVADFMRINLQNRHPQVRVIPARKRGTPYSPDDPRIVAPLLQSNAVFLGPGSPTYTVWQLQDSLLWHMLLARHRLGAAIILASAATIAAGALALPVYEIYKVGEDPHWTPGLDLLGPYGLSLVFVSHWDNSDGGAELDTSHCFVGRERFEQLLPMLPAVTTVVGIDEHTALVMDFTAGECRVMGRGGMTLLRNRVEQVFPHGVAFPITELGPFHIPELCSGIRPDVWVTVAETSAYDGIQPSAQPSPEVLSLLQQRESARAERDWAAADALRARLTVLGWEVRDTPAGPTLSPSI